MSLLLNDDLLQEIYLHMHSTIGRVTQYFYTLHYCSTFIEVFRSFSSWSTRNYFHRTTKSKYKARWDWSKLSSLVLPDNPSWYGQHACMDWLTFGVHTRGPKRSGVTKERGAQTNTVNNHNEMHRTTTTTKRHKETTHVYNQGKNTKQTRDFFRPDASIKGRE